MVCLGAYEWISYIKEINIKIIIIIIIIIIIFRNYDRRHCFKRVSIIANALRHIFPSVNMEQLGSHSMDFHEIWYSSIFWKYVQKIQVSLKSDKNNGHFTWRSICIFDHISLILPRMRNVSDKIYRESLNTRFTLNKFIFFLNRAVYEIIW